MPAKTGLCCGRLAAGLVVSAAGRARPSMSLPAEPARPGAAAEPRHQRGKAAPRADRHAQPGACCRAAADAGGSAAGARAGALYVGKEPERGNQRREREQNEVAGGRDRRGLHLHRHLLRSNARLNQWSSFTDQTISDCLEPAPDYSQEISISFHGAPQ
jgi:hypothetical protein